MIDKDKLKVLVELFYADKPFKIFTINTKDGENFCKPIGYFVSLGITSSLKTIQRVCDNIRDGGFNVRVVEISSRDPYNTKIFLNKVIKEENIEQYNSPIFDNVYSKEESLEILNKLIKERESLSTDSSDFMVLSARIYKLRGLIDIMDERSEWADKAIQEVPGEEYFRIYHLKINYRKDEDLEYRVGIFVEDK